MPGGQDDDKCRMDQITVYKLNETGDVVWQYPASVLERGSSWIRLEAFFNLDDLDLGFVTLKRGDRFVENFYSDRWYNIFAVYDGLDRDLQGWYCNICRPAQLGDTAVRCEDLALDLWVAPDGRAQVLDEDEFGMLKIDADERRKCLDALQKLQEIAKLDQLPR